MSIPHRAWEAPTTPTASSIGRGFTFPETVARDPSEFTTREHLQELLAPVISRLRQGDFTAALRASERLHRQRPEYAWTVLEHARLLLASGAIAEASMIVEMQLQRTANHSEALKLMGFAKLQQGDLLQALALFGQAVKRSPADSFAQINCNALRQRLRRSPGNEPPTTSLRPVVATSLPPVGLDMSLKAVHSWLERGCKVLSVNTAAERDLLSPHFPDVEFYLCEETAKEEFGKEYQYLDSLLDALAQTAHPLCAIINADIILRDDPSVWGQVCAAAETRFVYGSRVNVAHLQAQQGTLLEPGFDYFIFPAAQLPRIPRTGFIMGQPAWDIFLPAWMARCNTPLAFCYSPLALHVEHKTQWKRTINSRFLVMAASWLAPELARLVMQDAGCHQYLRVLTMAFSQVLSKAPKAGAEALFCRSPMMNACLAPVDALYFVRDNDETLLLLGA